MLIQSIWDFLKLAEHQKNELFSATAAHLDLVMEALLLAVLIGVPAGIAASRSRRVERAALGLANILQTVPSLALLGFLVILFQGTIGKPPALTALVIYALLPILKNTILGLRGIDAALLEAAEGMGMTPWQRMRLVELPLAVPVLLGGIRVATVASIGMATIAAAIGAAGLGTYIYRGVSLSDSRLILLGALPAALLAIACDAALGEIERNLDPTRPRTSIGRRIAAGLGILLLLGAAGFGAYESRPFQATSGKIVIGSKDGSEMILLGEMLAILVEEKTGLSVDRRFNLGGTLVCYNALRQGGLDLYVEYTGTALTTILKEPPDNDPERVRVRVSKELERRDEIEMLAPFGFENTFAILMSCSKAKQLGIETISDLAGHTKTLQSGFGPEFMNRPDGYPGLMRAYGLEFGPRPIEMDRNLLYKAIHLGSVDVAAGDSTDGRIAVNDLVSLRDDRRYFPPYEAIPLVRAETLKRYPNLRATLDLLGGKINAETMRRLNQEVDGNHREPAEVARKFLESVKLIKAD